MRENFSQSNDHPFVPTESGRDKGVKDAAHLTPEENKFIVDARKSAASKELHPVELSGAPGQSDKQSVWDIVTAYHPGPVGLPVHNAHPNHGADQPGDTHSEAGSIEDWGIDIDNPEHAPFVHPNHPFLQQDSTHGEHPVIESVPNRPPLEPASRNRSPQTASPPPDAHANWPTGADENNPPGSVRGGADGGL